jgi:hypothetical protein
VEAKGLEPSNLLTASQALYQLSYAPGTSRHVTSLAFPTPWLGLWQRTLDRRLRVSPVGGTVTAPTGPWKRRRWYLWSVESRDGEAL